MSIPCNAEDTALLVGVGNYLNSAHNLPGIDIDLDTMQSVSLQLGYTKTITLRDKKATRANILETLQALKLSLSPTDRFLFYFSGHGTQVPDLDGDERDAVDEALAAADVESIVIDHMDTLKGVIIDDDLSAILQSFSTKQTLSIIDACHSGSIAKRSFVKSSNASIARRGYVKKMLEWPGMNSIRRHTSSTDYNAVNSPYISIASAGDEEYAIATESGSVFTRAIRRALLDYANQQGTFESKELTPYNLVEFAGDFIYQLVSPYERYTPEISGNPLLFHQPLFDEEKQKAYPEFGHQRPNTEKLNRLINNNELQLRSSKVHYRQGEPLDLQVTLPYSGSGYLNIVHVDSHDQVRVIFPSSPLTDNKITFSAGNLALSKLLSKSSIDIIIRAKGVSSLYALITDTPIYLSNAVPLNHYNQPRINYRLVVGKVSLEFE